MSKQRMIGVIPPDFAIDMKRKFKLPQVSIYYWGHNECFNPNKPQEEYIILPFDMIESWELGETFSAFTPAETSRAVGTLHKKSSLKYIILVIRIILYLYFYSRKHRN